MPEITPVVELNERPFGKVPVSPKLAGLFVPVIVYENAIPTVPPGLVALLITGAGGLIVKVSV